MDNFYNNKQELGQDVDTIYECFNCGDIINGADIISDCCPYCGSNNITVTC